MIEITNTKIIENKKLSDGIFHLELELPYSYPHSKPGQFVNVYLNNNSKLLPRPISIFNHLDGHIHLVYAVMGEGTKELSSYKPETEIRISTPLGNGFTIPNYDKNVDDDKNAIVLIGGGLGVAPLHYLARSINIKYRDSINKPLVYAVLGFKDKPVLTEQFEKYCFEVQTCLEIPSDEFADCWDGNVIFALNECEYHFNRHFIACGPHPMLAALNDYVKEIEKMTFQVSMEERMGCGFGTCVGCSIELKDDLNNIIRKKVCKDGPVFMGNEVVW